jgi:isochorismate synthase
MTIGYFEGALREAAELEGWRTISSAAPALDLEAIAFETADLEDQAFLWDPPRSSDGDLGTAALRFAGFGVAAELSAGSAGLADLARPAGAIVRACARFAHAETEPSLARPRFFGGLAFASEPAEAGERASNPWRAFGAGAFVLPRWTYAESSRGRALTLALRPTEGRDRGSREAIVRELARILGPSNGIAESPVPLLGVGPFGARMTTEPPLDVWCREIDAIQHLIREGGARKVVAARHTRVEFDGPFSHREVVCALAGQPMCTRFVFRRGTATFAGATPELLIAKMGPRVISEALAGSSRAADAAAMFASAKEREEHALVVEFIARGLEAMTSELEYPREPRLRRLRDVVHLVTPFEGRVDPRAGCSILDLAAALHPTPAVAGMPRAKALEFLREHEPFARGWYAGPVGWFDSEGDGELRVALRSALLEPRCAHLFAGAGVVAGSDARAEYDEARLKERTLRTALGVEA